MPGNGAARPDWARLDMSFRRNPKIDELTDHGMYGWQAIVLYLDGITYSSHHLTDGFIPIRWPRSNGYSQRSVELLLSVELWWEARNLNLDSRTTDGSDPPLVGYLINDYDAYQISRAKWTETGRKRREASAKAHAAKAAKNNGQAH